MTCEKGVTKPKLYGTQLGSIFTPEDRNCLRCQCSTFWQYVSKLNARHEGVYESSHHYSTSLPKFFMLLFLVIGCMLQDPKVKYFFYEDHVMFLTKENVIMKSVMFLMFNRTPGELSVVKHAILDWRLPVHLIYFIICEPEKKFLGYHSIPTPVLIEHQGSQSDCYPEVV